MLNSKPSKSQEKAWLSKIAEHGCVVTGSSQVQLHHCIGREGKHNKMHIGRKFVIPLHIDLHCPNSNHPHNVTHHRKAFVKQFGLESELFKRMCEDIGDTPVTDEEMAAIMDTRR